MLTAENSSVLANFLERLSVATEAALVLDYDGVVEPSGTSVGGDPSSVSLMNLVESIVVTCRTRVAVFSARQARSVADDFSHFPRPEIWGRGGFERLLPNDRYESVRRVHPVEDAFAELDAWFELNGIGKLVTLHPERIVVSWDGLPDREAHEARTCAVRVLTNLRNSPDLSVDEFPTAIEVRARSMGIGHLLHTMIDELADDVLIAYIASKMSDPAGFRVVKGNGMGVLVAGEAGKSDAEVLIQPPDQLIRFLADWVYIRGGN